MIIAQVRRYCARGSQGPNSSGPFVPFAMIRNRFVDRGVQLIVPSFDQRGYSGNTSTASLSAVFIIVPIPLKDAGSTDDYHRLIR